MLLAVAWAAGSGCRAARTGIYNDHGGEAGGERTPLPLKLVVVPSPLDKALEDWEIVAGIRAVLQETVRGDRWRAGAGRPNATVLPAKQLTALGGRLDRAESKRQATSKRFQEERGESGLTQKQLQKLEAAQQSVDAIRDEFAALAGLRDAYASGEAISLHVYFLGHGVDGKISLLNTMMGPEPLFQHIIRPLANLLPSQDVILHLRSCGAMAAGMAEAAGRLLAQHYPAGGKASATLDGPTTIIMPAGAPVTKFWRVAADADYSGFQDHTQKEAAEWGSCTGHWASSEANWTEALGRSLAWRASGEELRAICPALWAHLGVVESHMKGEVAPQQNLFGEDPVWGTEGRPLVMEKFARHKRNGVLMQSSDLKTVAAGR